MEREKVESEETSWIRSEPNPYPTAHLDEFRFFAILGTWMEADIVAASIRNAFTQGCERVYVVDNASHDGTAVVAAAEGAIVETSYSTTYYDEPRRMQEMNAIVSRVSRETEAQQVWWLYLDADEFPHGPRGLTLVEYLRTLDARFRVVGARFFNHYPGDFPHYEHGRHPLDYQPLCEELSYPMCPSHHRKHSIIRIDKNGPAIECDRGFHSAKSSHQLIEPEKPIRIHHFPFRQYLTTKRRLEALWHPNGLGVKRARESDDATGHMIARFRSLEAVYSQDWARVENFITQPASVGVELQHWRDRLPAADWEVRRWYSVDPQISEAAPMIGVWQFGDRPKFRFGDDTTYRRGMAFLNGHGVIEDWGCGFCHAREFVSEDGLYYGVDGSSQHAHKIADLVGYRSETDCIFMRHVLEHNVNWELILDNAIASFRSRMVLILFTPLGNVTRTIATSNTITSRLVPDISFRKQDIVDRFAGVHMEFETLQTDTQYGQEHVFYLDKLV